MRARQLTTPPPPATPVSHAAPSRRPLADYHQLQSTAAAQQALVPRWRRQIVEWAVQVRLHARGVEGVPGMRRATPKPSRRALPRRAAPHCAVLRRAHPAPLPSTQVAHEFRLSDETVALAVNLFDRLLSAVIVPPAELQVSVEGCALLTTTAPRPSESSFRL